MDQDTLPAILQSNARTHPDEDAIREKTFGVWQTYSWHQYAYEVRRLALGLAALGFQRGDTLAVIGDNRPRLYCAMLAAQSLGGVSLAVYQDSIAKELGYVLEHAEVRIIVAENEEQIDKLYEIKDRLHAVQQVIYDDSRGLELKEDPWLLHYPDVQQSGDEFGAANPSYFDDELAKGRREDFAVLCYTSGTTGDPKGVILTHENFVTNARETEIAEGLVAGDELMAYLPMAWVGDYWLSVAAAIAVRLTVNCPENRDTLSRDAREIGPTLIVAPPAVWEQLLTRVQVRMDEADWFKSVLYRRCMAVALDVERRRQRGQPVPGVLAFKNGIGDWLVRRPLRDLLGVSRIRRAYTGGAPLGPDVFDYLRAIGINLKQLYGMTESSSACVYQPEGEANSETVGRALRITEVRISESGEILLRGPNIFKGYFKNEEATRRTLDSDGWLASGDAGFVDERGHLRVVDRAKDVSKLADGTLFAPQFLENKIKFSPFIKEAVVLGKELDYAAAMINIDLEALENWAERHAVSYSGYQDLSQKPEVYSLVHDEIARINTDLAGDPALEGAQIRRFLVLNKELDADDGEITRTRKIRRGVIAERYAALIEALYNGAERVESEIVVTYEDGSSGSIHADLQVMNIGAWEPAAPLRQSA